MWSSCCSQVPDNSLATSPPHKDKQHEQANILPVKCSVIHGEIKQSTQMEINWLLPLDLNPWGIKVWNPTGHSDGERDAACEEARVNQRKEPFTLPLKNLSTVWEKSVLNQKVPSLHIHWDNQQRHRQISKCPKHENYCRSLRTRGLETNFNPTDNIWGSMQTSQSYNK